MSDTLSDVLDKGQTEPAPDPAVSGDQKPEETASEPATDDTSTPLSDDSDADASAETADTASAEKSGPKSRFEKRIQQLIRQRQELEREAQFWKQKALGSAEPNLSPPPAAPVPGIPPKPTIDQFETTDQYLEAVVEWRIQKREIEQNLVRSQQEFTQKLNVARAELPDFDEVIQSGANVPIFPETSKLILESPYGPWIAYEIAKDENLASRLIRNPISAAAEIGRLEAKIEAQRQSKGKGETATAKSPPPPPVRPPSSSPGASDRITGKESLAEYIAKRRRGIDL